MKQRVITALLAVPLLSLLVWLGNPWFALLVAIGALLAAWEFYRLAEPSGEQPLRIFGLIWILLLVANAHFDSRFTAPLLTSAVLFSLIGIVFLPRKQKAFAGWAWTLAGILYIGWMLSHYISLRELSDGRGWVFLALFSTFAGDTFAFLIGRAAGRHLLAPTISPKKTWEGAIAGFVATIATALIISVFFKLPLSYAHIIFLGSLIGISGQLGDLAESLLKRNAGAKDSGNLIPGHGGILDRIDSVIFTGVIVYYYVKWLIL